MISARWFILTISLISLIYDRILTNLADKQRKNPLPEEVADVYDADRYQTYLAYVADSKKISGKYKIINLIFDVILIFSPMYSAIDKICDHNPYVIFVVTYLIIWILGTTTGICSSYEVTFGVMERYGLNKKDKKEFAKDEILENGFSFVLMIALGELLTYIGEHMAIWTHNFSVGYVGSLIVCVVVFLVIFIFMSVAKLIGYAVLRAQYTFTPLEDGELKDKINALQADSRKKVKNIYVYNESKKTTTKNAFLLKLFMHREFGIADNFMNENAENELLAVLSHEIGHLKHKKNLLDFIGYGMWIVGAAILVLIVANPSAVLAINSWIKTSFGIEANSFYLIIIVFEDILKPIMFATGVFGAYKSRVEEYEADREAVKNGYGEDLIRTFKNLSKDELINVNPHPFIEFTEYDHPGMYQRIKAIHAKED